MEEKYKVLGFKDDSQDKRKFEIVVEDDEELLPAEQTENSLEDRTKSILQELIDETNVEKVKDLTKLFNLNQVKKNAVRVVEVDNLIDNVLEKAEERLEKVPDEFSNKDYLDYLQVLHNIKDKDLKSINAIDETPLVQINQQTNEFSFTVGDSKISKDTQEKVLDVVQKVMQFSKNTTTFPVIDSPQTVDLSSVENEEKEN